MELSALYTYSKLPKVIFEDYYLAVLYKPAGYTVERHPVYPSCEDFLHQHLQQTFPENKRHFVGVVHRLDVLVGGLLVMAKTRSALKVLNNQFATGKTTKFYQALLEQPIQPLAGSIEGWIEEDKKNKKAIFHFQENTQARKAMLHYKVVGDNGSAHEVEIKLETGRFHQIRVSFAAVGSPIINDVKYGAKPLEGIESIGLVAVELAFDHPKTNERLSLDIKSLANK